MPSFDIIKETNSSDSFRSNVLRNTYEISNEKIIERFTGSLNIDNLNWNVGLIYGRSGTGKSSIAKELFLDSVISDFSWSSSSFIDDFDKSLSVEKLSQILTSVGLSTIPSWLKPYHVLSEGEKMRARLARALLERDFIVFDEFTSVVDREVAKIASFVTSKTVRKLNKKFIAVSCHSDVLDWLEPDWTFNTDTMKFELSKKKDQKLNYQFTRLKDSGHFLESIII